VVDRQFVEDEGCSLVQNRRSAQLVGRGPRHQGLPQSSRQSRFVGIPVLELGSPNLVDVGFATQCDDDVDVADQLRINE